MDTKKAYTLIITPFYKFNIKVVNLLSTPNKRHYRVAKRDIESFDELTDDYTYDLRSLTVLGIVIYTLSIVTTFVLGYMIGRHDG